jgi:ABC-type Fe3+/spermidine/putrescine transport system ATPase subunit
MSAPILQLRGVTKIFSRTVHAVNELSLEVEKGEFFALLGPSGCGKTTTLRLIAGLEMPDAGEIVYRDRVIASKERGIRVPPEKRQMGMVFQSYAIWPHLSVFENIAYPLKVRRAPSAVIRERVHAVLELLNLDGLADRQAPQLSGGQQQRVALARALIHEPELLLLDEPFSNLDTGLRGQMRVEMKLLQRRLGITVILVTHDQTEALSLCDRIAVMCAGRCEQVGLPAMLYGHPVTPYVRDFLGRSAVLEGSVEAVAADGAVSVRLVDGSSVIVGPAAAADGVPPVASPAAVSIRPEHIRLHLSRNGHTLANAFEASVEALLFMGQQSEARLCIAGGKHVEVPVSPQLNLQEGQSLLVELPPEHLKLWRS